ncbi:MAG: hypothetical protein ACRDD1_21325, partial [Planctomycetia bacterium]
IYHAIGHIAAAVRAIWGDGADAERRRQHGVTVLVVEGKTGIERSIAGPPAGCSTHPMFG